MSETQMVFKFESLPNEILIKCFNYFPTLDLHHSFGQLNHRFEQLLDTLPWRLNFEGVKRETYDAFCEDLLRNPDTQQRICSLRLSDQNTPGLIDDFFSKFSVDQFSHLRSVTFLDLPPTKNWRLRETLPKLSQIIALYIYDSDMPYSDRLKYHIPIANLQTLSMNSELHFVNKMISIKSLTLHYLSLNDICRLFQYTPLLRYFKVSAIWEEIFEAEYYQSPRPPHLTQLNLGHFSSTFDDLIHFLQNMSNLRRLTIDYRKDESIMDASRWEELITSYLPHLKDFRFILTLTLPSDKPGALAIFNRFQTNFWLQEHQWCTECSVNTQYMKIYTLPYIIECKDIRFGSKIYSNSLINKPKTFESVKELHLSAESSLMPTDFSHLKYLKIDIDCVTETHSLLFQILGQAPQLSSLSTKQCFLQSLSKNPKSHRYLNGKIRKLELSKDYCGWGCYREISILSLHQILPDVEQLTIGKINVDDLFFLLNQFLKLSSFRVLVSSSDRGYQRFIMQALEQNILFDEDKHGGSSVYLGVWIRRDAVVTKSEEDSQSGLSYLQYKLQHLKEQLYRFGFGSS